MNQTCCYLSFLFIFPHSSTKPRQKQWPWISLCSIACSILLKRSRPRMCECSSGGLCITVPCYCNVFIRWTQLGECKVVVLSWHPNRRFIYIGPVKVDCIFLALSHLPYKMCHQSNNSFPDKKIKGPVKVANKSQATIRCILATNIFFSAS